MTAASPKLSYSHGAAAMNALSCFIERASVSCTPDISKLCFDLETWRRILEIYLLRSECYKHKPMRLLLLSIFTMVSKNPEQEIQFAETEYAMTRALSIIYNGNGSTAVKPAFQVLEHLLAKGFLDAASLVRAVADPSKDRVIAGAPQKMPSVQIDDAAVVPRIRELAQIFILKSLAWARYADLAAAAGKAITAFVRSFSIAFERNNMVEERETPVWVKPLRQLLQERAELIDIVESHVLPELLKGSFNEVIRFLETFPLKDICNGDTSEMTDSDTMLFLLALDAATASKPPRSLGKLKSPPFSPSSEV